MGADAAYAPRQGGTFLVDYATFAEFLEELIQQKLGFGFHKYLVFNTYF
jgi:hypothetical protein